MIAVSTARPHPNSLDTTSPSDRVDLRDGAAPRANHQGGGSRTAGLTMAFKLLEAAAGHWRRLDAPDSCRWSERGCDSSCI